MNVDLMPVLFVGHGSPMNAIENNHFTAAWQELGRKFPVPKTIVCISAHWETHGTFVTAMPQPRTIYDFGGFPRQLYEIQYPAPGHPELAKEFCDFSASQPIQPDLSWGLDHGVWSVLVHLFPEAQIPVIQLSLNRLLTPKQHFELAKSLVEFRKKGVLFVSSGNIVHNLRTVDWHNTQNKYDWATRVSEKVKGCLINKDEAELMDFENFDNDFRLAINSAEHFIPLLYLMGLRTEQDKLSFFNDEILMGSLSMTGVLLD